MQNGEQIGHGIRRLEDEREHNADRDTDRNANEPRNAEDAHGNDHQNGKQHEGVHVEGSRDSVAYALRNAGIVTFRTRVYSQECI